MTEFTHYDFTESVAQADGFEMADIAKAIAAWGENGDYAEWFGGFLLHLKNGRFAYIEGWCNTTGWGCQDGVETWFFDAHPALTELQTTKPENVEWDCICADLNRVICGEIEEF